MTEPAICCSGITYERSAIENWLSRHENDPVTRVSVDEKTLYPNRLVYSLVDEYIASFYTC